MLKHILLVFLTISIFHSFAQWSPTSGPGGGTINQFYEVEGVLYTATGGGAGGIFRSYDNGESWEISNKGLPLQEKASSINGDEDYLYAGFSLKGIFRSDDLGETWQASNNGISDFGLSILTIYESAGIVYIGTFVDGIYISSDHGDNWTLKSNGLEGAAKRVAAFTSLNSKLYIATPLGVYKSENGGDNWSPSSNGIPADKVYSFDIVAKDELLFVAALDGIYRSTDYGNTWIKIDNELFSSGLYTIEIFEDDIYSGSNGKVYRSSDNGDNWTEIGTGIPQYSYVYAIHANENSIVCGINSQGVFNYHSDDNQWYQSNAGLINENVSDFMLDGDLMFASTLRNDFGQIFKTSNNGGSWDLSNNGGWNGGYDVLSNSGDYYLAGANGSFLYRSSNQGEFWENIIYPDFPASYISSFCKNNQVDFAASFGSTLDVYRSTDEGLTWSGCNLPGEGHIMGMLSEGEYIFAGRSDGVFRSDDLGLNWIKTSNGMGEFSFIKKFASNGDYIFATSYDGLYRSDNNGEEWEKIYSPPFSNRIESIATYEDFLFIGTMETGLLYSTDNGETWVATNPDFFQDPTGFIPAVIAIEIKDDSVYASYQNFSVWVRSIPNITGIENNQAQKSYRNIHNLRVFPNPVYGNSTISYSLSKSGDIKLYLFDLSGNERKSLIRGYKIKGDHHLSINAKDLYPGIYFLALESGSELSYQKIIVVDK